MAIVSYAKYGTTFDNVMPMIDKVAPSGCLAATTKAYGYTELIGLLSEIRHDRPASQLPLDERERRKRDDADSARHPAVPPGASADARGNDGAGGVGPDNLEALEGSSRLG